MIVLVIASIYHIILSMSGVSILKEIVTIGHRNNNANFTHSLILAFLSLQYIFQY